MDNDLPELTAEQEVRCELLVELYANRNEWNEWASTFRAMQEGIRIGRESAAPQGSSDVESDDREEAPPNNLPDWSECDLRVRNSDFIAERVAGGGHGMDSDAKLATQLHRFIYEYDDADPYRSAWFLHRLELLLEEVRTSPATSEPVMPVAPSGDVAAALRLAASVIELYDDAMANGDYMLSSTDCAIIIEGLIPYVTRAAAPVAPSGAREHDELVAALDKIAGLAPGEGDVCEVIARIARDALAKVAAPIPAETPARAVQEPSAYRLTWPDGYSELAEPKDALLPGGFSDPQPTFQPLYAIAEPVVGAGK